MLRNKNAFYYMLLVDSIFSDITGDFNMEEPAQDSGNISVTLTCALPSTEESYDVSWWTISVSKLY